MCTTLSTKELSSKLLKWYDFPIDLSNKLATLITLLGLTYFTLIIPMKTKMSYGLSTPITHTTPFQTMTFLFLKLSKVRIFPIVSVLTKKPTLDRALTLQMLFLENSEQAKIDNA
jgi:hypothetical protein